MEGGPGVPIPGAAFISPISFQRQAATTASTARNCRSVWRKIQDHDTTLELPRQTSKRGPVDPGQTLPAGKLFENSDVGAVNDQQETSAVQCTRLQNGWHAR